MALGSNRDYKTRARSATMNLRLHKTMMDELIGQGKTLALASEMAYQELMSMSHADRRKMWAQVIKANQEAKNNEGA